MADFLPIENFTCRPDQFGAPRCKLAELDCKTIEIRGYPFLDVLKYQEDNISFSKDKSRPNWNLNQFDVFIVGEAPSAEEDKCGVPFQGKAGKILHDYIVNSNLDPNKVFITNIIRCRPPKNRRPTAKETKECLPHLFREIVQIRPKIFILLGNTALKLFKLNKEGGIMSIRGKIFKRKLPDWEDGPTFKVIPTIHPAAFLHKQSPESKKLMYRVRDDYDLAAHTIKTDDVPSFYVPDWQLIDDVDKLDNMIEEIKESKFFAFDTESCALPFTKEPLINLSFCWGFPSKTAVLPWMQHDPKSVELRSKQHFNEVWLKDSFGSLNSNKILARLRKIFEDKDIAKAAHQAKYDMNVIRWHLNIRTKGFIYDPMIMHHLLDESPPHNLAFLADTEFKVGDYEEPRRKITGKNKLINKFDKVPDDIMWPYTCTDAECTFRLAKTYEERLKKKPYLWKLYCEESEPGIHSLAIPEWHGSLIYKDVAVELKKQAEEGQIKLLTKIRKITKPDFNPLSNPQVVQAFIDLGFGEHIKEKKAASGYSTDKKKLNEIKDEIELASQILEYRTNRKMISTYYDHAINEVDVDGRIRYSFKQHGTVTGRLAASFVHQIRKIDERLVFDDNKNYIPLKDRFPNCLVMRDMFIPKSRYKYVYGDFSQIELRILAIISKDLELKRVFKEGLDLHAITTAEILKPIWKGNYNEEIAKRDKFNRAEVGKRVNFGLAYGSKGHALVKTGKWKDWNGIERSFTWEMLNEGMDNWKNRFKGVGNFLDNKPDEVRWNGNTAVNCFNRERHFGGKLNDENDYEREEAERECVNYFIQSAAGGITNRTINEIHAYLTKQIETNLLLENAVYLVNTVHDSLTYEVREDLVPWFSEVFRIIATRPIPELDYEQFPIDLGVGDSWTDAECM